MKTMRAFGLFLLGLLLVNQSVAVWSQQTMEALPVFACDEMVHDFGRIRETERYATHQFVIKNTGTAPLIILHVLSSCGCAQPEWSQKPIEPGEEGFVVVTYDMVDRPGPFRKNINVFTNESRVRQQFTILGDVIPKPQALEVLFHDSIGSVQLERTSFMFHTMIPHEIASSEVWIRNFGEEDVNVTIEDAPEYLTITVPSRLESDYPERLKIELDGTKVDEKMRGRVLTHFTWKEVNSSGTTTKKLIPISVNFIDDFTGMNSAEKADGPSVQFSTRFLEYGKLKKKRVYKELAITNVGKSTLNLHSITVDNPNVQIIGFNKRALQPQETLKVRVYVNPKDFTNYLSTELYVISSDPKEPVREVQISAEK